MAERFRQSERDEKLALLAERTRLAECLQADPYCIDLLLDRSDVYELLGYPDLAAMDTYKAMLLIDEVMDDSGEYYEDAMDSLQSYIASHSRDERIQVARNNIKVLHLLQATSHAEDVHVSEDEAQSWVQSTWQKDAPVKLAYLLASIGCLKSAYEFVLRTLRSDPDHKPAREEQKRIIEMARGYFKSNNIPWDDHTIEVSKLPDRGHVRREVYPWNEHEMQRTSPDALSEMNRAMSVVAPKLEVRATELELLHPSGSRPFPGRETVQQLGVFAKEHLEPGEEILRERSILTANSRLHEPMCDACSSRLPDLSVSTEPAGSALSEENPLPCPDCDDTIFCSASCLHTANALYHPALCGRDVESIAKEVPPAEAADALYTLLLMRVLAMSCTQGTHPLDLKEVKYIWGDFDAPDSKLTNGLSGMALFENALKSLPFTFSANILLPLHVLEKMDVPIFTVQQDLAETWVYNTLYAKFRGTASARISPRDGRPEVAAVHPLWCMANHSCDPNVQWEWSGEIKFHVRQSRAVYWKQKSDGSREQRKPLLDGAIAEDEQIFNHYVDIDLPVHERREWGVGALGGVCMCQRCVWESSTD